MGLKEKGAANNFQETKVPEYSKQIADILGSEVAITVDWDSITEVEQPENFEENWSKVYFDPIVKALTDLCVDDFTKGAVAEGVKSIDIKVVDGGASDYSWATFADGAVSLNHAPANNVDNVDARADALKGVIEGAL